ncbi:Stk1 family PASTA domain-containing Ser/Thr kinase [Streptomyces fimicarius]|uniref:non-specific serine/threonine protein kinase n=1 Tax=Streptomyces caviscabies TaxID=90079 RepID=A0ABW2M5U1_9ACTN|nr:MULTISPECIES: Stk1 family PASTA domain-containing Ser/Thr kinase [Streptomyces]MCX4708238.1 Stk1 family PASTA domain-containing Ser/Thr kinase [Streptomyces griseus]MDX2668859.1 Stk1 family PASTA domain-containing Ser/Thr kinase [Streptomyces sp. NRRL_ISP-5395]MDX3501446.1 Stk1 family PASTA domain-containing Ser/Thr kinase [Streptomyces sp. ATCC51928]MDX5521436.1 Stk1 family PASTA domain-containing Ser/Thr kinase [Streptomyces sp. DE06-01C]GHF37968.1 serine/threonine protein kinase [Strepto
MDTTLQDPLVGQLLDGRYRIEARIAVGGMATVYRAVDTRLDRVLALKVMHPALATDVSFVERFIREAKSVARLAHPNVVAVFDQGAQGAYVYLAMEYVAGCTLRDVLRERGALQPRAALDILEPVLAALGAAHRAGFVHRDMKPENVLIGDDGRVKVADFGLVRAVGTATDTTGSLLGTVSYLAPEQIEHGSADTRSDVYACGVVLYEMLTGAKPHTGENAAQVIYQHLNSDVPAPSAVVPGLPVALDSLVASATARNPEVRPHDAVLLLAETREARAALTDAELDAVPPQALSGTHDGADDRTSVIPRALPADGDGAGVHRTSRLEMPPAGPAAPRRGTARSGPFGGPHRKLITILTAVLLTLGIGTGVWYINSGQFTQVPSLLGQTQKTAEQRLSDEGLGLKGVDRVFSDTVERGSVVSSEPASGERIRGNGAVKLVVSRGPEIVRVPDVVGSSLADARRALKKVGLAPGMVTKEFSEDVARGEVIRTDPRAGTDRNPDTAVALVVSKGAPVEVPDVSGLSVEDATAELEAEGLKAEVLPGRVHSAEVEGDVTEQSPAEGAEAAEGDTVQLTISKGPRMLDVPDVTGRDVDEARSTLEEAGFEVEVERPFLSFSDTIASQSVDGGEQAPEGSTITIKTKGF